MVSYLQSLFVLRIHPTSHPVLIFRDVNILHDFKMPLAVCLLTIKIFNFQCMTVQRLITCIYFSMLGRYVPRVGCPSGTVVSGSPPIKSWLGSSVPFLQTSTSMTCEFKTHQLRFLLLFIHSLNNSFLRCFKVEKHGGDKLPLCT